MSQPASGNSAKGANDGESSDPSSTSASAPATSAAASSSSASLTTSSAATLAPLTATPPVIPSNHFGLTYMPSFLSAAECDEVIALQETHALSPLYPLVKHWVLQVPTEPSLKLHPLIARLQARMLAAPCFAKVRGLATKNAWLLQYPVGSTITPHTDKAQELTCLVYLNTVPEGQGGQTHFTKLGLKLQPVQGDALMWRTVEEDGVTTIAQSEHEGLACEQIKYALNCGFKLS